MFYLSARHAEPAKLVGSEPFTNGRYATTLSSGGTASTDHDGRIDPYDCY
jgi:hypothetical protein